MTDQQRAREIAKRWVMPYGCDDPVSAIDSMTRDISAALAAVRAEDKVRIETLEQALREIADSDKLQPGQTTGQMRTYQMREVARAALGGPR